MDLFNEFFSKLDVVEFIEKNLILEGKPFLYTNNGRAFMKGILRYCAHSLPHSKKAKPVCVVKGRQTGASTMSAALSVFFMRTLRHRTILHSFPEKGMSNRHSSHRLKQLLEDSILQGGLPKNFQDKKGTDSLAQKDFQNSNVLYVEAVSKDGRRVRGLSSDLILYDEAASMTRTAFDNSLQCAANTAFEYVDGGSTIPHLIFGTPEAENSFFDSNVWRQSDQRRYHLHCQKCGHYYPVYFNVTGRATYETNMLEGTLVKCLDEEGQGCGAANDKLGPAMDEGKWIPSKLTDDCKYVSFYMPQYLNGRITKEMIVDQFEKMPAREFYNEVLGLFYSFEEDALTKQQIIKLTSENPDTSEWGLPAHVQDKYTFMGIDWGGRVSGVDDTGSGSYTVCTIFSILPTGHIKLEHASRLSTNDTDEKVKKVTDLMRRYNVIKCVADKGYGQSEGQRLQKLHGIDRFSMCEWGGHTKKAIGFDQDSNTIRADKHVAHEIFFDEMRQEKFCFPFNLQAEQELDWLLDHMVNIEVITVEKQGMLRKEYRKKTGKETDGLASLIYAYTAFQFWKTNGFKLSRSQQGGRSQRGTSGLQPLAIGVGRRSSSTSGNKINYSRHDRRRR